MFINPAIVDIIFRILNFTLLIAIVAYVYKKYLLDGFKKDMVDKQVYLENLRARGIDLAQKSLALEKSVLAQEQLRKDLISKLAKWNKVYSEEQELKLDIQKKVLLVMEERAKKQAENIKIIEMNKNVLPLALESCKQKLEDKFQSHEQGKAYLSQVISFMKGS